jgi:hypothetical protein
MHTAGLCLTLVGLSLRGDWENLGVQRGPNYTEGTFRAVGLAITITMH